MQRNALNVFLTRIFFMGFLGVGLQPALVASQYPLLNPGIGPSSLKTGTQPFSTMSISGANTNPVVMSATTVDNITVGFTYSPAAEDFNVVSYSIDFTKLTPAAPIPAAAIAAGISVQISLVEAANTLSFPNINSFQKSYFWNSGPSAANTLVVVIVGADGTVYAAGACAAFFIPTFAPIAYQVTINSGLASQMSTVQIPMTTASVQGVKIQSGVVSTPNMVTYPLFNSTIWGVGAPTNPAAFSAVSANSTSSSKIVMGINNLQNVNVNFNYTATSAGAVTYSVDLTTFNNVSSEILQAGLYLQIDLVPAAQAASYSAAALYPHSYFWGGPSASNTMYISLVDTAGNIYAAGGCTGNFASQYTPTSYVVTINAGTDTQMETQVIPVNGTSTPVVLFQSGVASSPATMVSYPLINSTVWSVPAPTNPAAFSAVSILGNAQNNVTLGIREFKNLAVQFDYTTTSNAVTYAIDLTQYNSIPTSVLEAGLFCKIDLVPSAESASYPSVNLIPHSYFWGGPGAANTMFVSLVDASGNIYAAGACTGDFASQYTPTAYRVLVNTSSLDQVSTLSIPIAAGNAQGVMIQQGGISAPASQVGYPLFNSTIWGVPVPSSTIPFAAITGQTTGSDIVTLQQADMAAISVSYNYGTTSGAVSFDFNFASNAAITPALLKAGLYVKTDLVPAVHVPAYPSINFIQHSYFYGGSTAVDVMIASLVDGQGRVYAIGGCTGTFANQFVPTSYVVTLYQSNGSHVSSAPVPFAAATVPAVLIQTQPAAPKTTPSAPTAVTNATSLIKLLELHRELAGGNLSDNNVTPPAEVGAIASTDKLINVLEVHKHVAAALGGTTVVSLSGLQAATTVTAFESMVETSGKTLSYINTTSNQIPPNLVYFNIASNGLALIVDPWNHGLFIPTSSLPTTINWAVTNGVKMSLLAFDGSNNLIADLTTLGVTQAPAAVYLFIFDGLSGAMLGNVLVPTKMLVVPGQTTVGAWNTNAMASGASLNVGGTPGTYPAVVQINCAASAATNLSLPTLGSLSYTALKSTFSSAGLLVNEVTTQQNITTSDTFSFTFGGLGFTMPKTTWPNTAVPNLYTLLGAIKAFQLSSGITYMMLAFDANNNLIKDLAKIPSLSGLNFYLFAYDAQGVSLFPAGISIPIASMGNIFNSITSVTTNAVGLDYNAAALTPANYPAALIVAPASGSATSAQATIASGLKQAGATMSNLAFNIPAGSTFTSINFNVGGTQGFGYSFGENPWNGSTTVGPQGISADISSILTALTPAQWSEGINFLLLGVDSSSTVIADITKTFPANLALYMFDNSGNLISGTPLSVALANGQAFDAQITVPTSFSTLSVSVGVGNAQQVNPPAGNPNYPVLVTVTTGASA